MHGLTACVQLNDLDGYVQCVKGGVLSDGDARVTQVRMEGEYAIMESESSTGRSGATFHGPSLLECISLLHRGKSYPVAYPCKPAMQIR